MTVVRSCLLSFLAIVPATAWAGGLTLAHPYPAGSSFAVWANDLATCIEMEFGVHVEVFGDAQLGLPTALAGSVAAGVVDATILPAASFGEVWPELGQLDTPGYVEDGDAARRLSATPALANRLQELGGWERDLVILGVGWRFGQIVGSSRDPESLRGRKIRAANPLHAAVLEELGASLVTVPFSEVFSAMQYGDIDGALVDSEQAPQFATASGLTAMAWGDAFTPFVSAHIAVMNQASMQTFGLENGNKVTEVCGWATEDFTERALASVESREQAWTPIAPDTGMAPWHEAISRSREHFILDPEIREAVAASLTASGSP